MLGATYHLLAETRIAELVGASGGSARKTQDRSYEVLASSPTRSLQGKQHLEVLVSVRCRRADRRYISEGGEFFILDLFLSIGIVGLLTAAPKPAATIARIDT